MAIAFAAVFSIALWLLIVSWLFPTMPLGAARMSCNVPKTIFSKHYLSNICAKKAHLSALRINFPEKFGIKNLLFLFSKKLNLFSCVLFLRSTSEHWNNKILHRPVLFSCDMYWSIRDMTKTQNKKNSIAMWPTKASMLSQMLLLAV